MYRFMMRTLGLILFSVLVVGGILLFGPRDNPDFDNLTNNAKDLTVSQLDAYLAQQEAQFTDIRPNQQKQIIWFDGKTEQTDIAIVYLHGFSASPTEIRPVPDMVAQNLGANLYYARLPGHARGSAPMGDVRVQDWADTLAESLSIGRALGKKVIIVSTSTGGTLAISALAKDTLASQVSGIVFISPNFGIKNKAADLARLPYFKTWGPLLAGKTRSFDARKPGQAENWTTSYPLGAVVPMMRLIDFNEGLDLQQTQIPALFYFSDDDQVVDAQKTRQFIAKWGGAVEVINPTLNAQDDEYSHVIAGDILSPSQNEFATEAITKWVNSLK